jgi:hypothetical protein
MESFKQWLAEDLGKSITSSGIDANPVNTGNQATIAVRHFAAEPQYSDEIGKVLGTDGMAGRQRAITDLVPQIAQNFGPVAGQRFTGMDISGAFNREYFPRQNLFMKSFMKRMMSKKMAKK